MRRIERRLREEIKSLEEELSSIKEDRQQFREHFIHRFKWWIKLLNDNQTPDLSWLIIDDTKYLRNFNWWSFY